ncbi:hypothetical protein DN069_30195 [Streptacidiphilus pinicola]|uniref:PepSY domain-containing protein n=1 Tax=Streptacidiphilus pinicola TaxID=2219663 RepID=A0A2X0IE93_9ACTN|nr:PepSY domain-containing protein [Streptacidiphilus pinicola]RAG81943.1 hypothetical protein DN069_30195 [Streptacidiphilus pinicola]
MSDPFEPGVAPDEPEEQVEQQEDLATLPAPALAPRRGAVRRVVSGPRSRWVAGGVVALVLIGGSAAVTAAVVHHGGERVAVAVGPDGLPGGLPGLKRVMVEGPGGPAGAVIVKGGQVVKVPGGVLSGGPDQLPAPGAVGGSAAPAPLPSLAADQAVTKAEAAVSGGKVESLASVPEQGGGSAWQAVVLGPDGVRHLVTLDGASGGVTSNTVLN